MLSLLQVTGEVLDSPPTSVASLAVKDGGFVLGLVKMWINIVFSHTASVCHLCHMQHDTQNLSSVQCLPSICPICPTQTQHMAAAQPLTPHFSPFCALMFCHQCHQTPAFSTIPLHLPVG